MENSLSNSPEALQDDREYTISPTTWHAIETQVRAGQTVSLDSLAESPTETGDDGEQVAVYPRADGEETLDEKKARAVLEALQAQGTIAKTADEHGSYAVLLSSREARQPYRLTHPAAPSAPSTPEAGNRGRKGRLKEKLGRIATSSWGERVSRVAGETTGTAKHYGNKVQSAESTVVSHANGSARAQKNEAAREADARAAAEREFEANRGPRLRLKPTEDELQRAHDPSAAVSAAERAAADQRLANQQVGIELSRRLVEDIEAAKAAATAAKGQRLTHDELLDLIHSVRANVIHEFLGREPTPQELEAYTALIELGSRSRQRPQGREKNDKRSSESGERKRAEKMLDDMDEQQRQALFDIGEEARKRIKDELEAVKNSGGETPKGKDYEALCNRIGNQTYREHILPDLTDEQCADIWEAIKILRTEREK